MVAPDLSNEVIAARIKAAFLAKQARETKAGRVYGMRTAAKNIAARGAEPKISAESWRKQLGRILDAEAIKPHETTRKLLAEEFGVDPARFGVGGALPADAMFLDLLTGIAIARRQIDKLEQTVVLLAEAREVVAA